MLKHRAGGILLHPTSLPSRYGIGDFGSKAYAFADFLKRAGVRYWQMLPLNYTASQTGYSPYNCFSAFAGNPLLISPDLLHRQGLLQKTDLENAPSFLSDQVDFVQVARFKHRMLNIAFQRFKQKDLPSAYVSFVRKNRRWLEDFAFFSAFKKTQGRCPWPQWPAPIRNRNQAAMGRFKSDFSEVIEREKFIQFLFKMQFSDLKDYCNNNGIGLFGDLPIYVVHDSADVWSYPALFKLRRDKRPKYIAGVPPDYFSKTGQFWGNPVYDWSAHARTGYRWWVERLRHNLNMFDLLRIDHFRGFEAYWQIPAAHRTAARGVWAKGPGKAFFEVVFRHIPQEAMVAEDLGYITSGVRELIEMYGFPSMKVLHFAFGSDSDNTHLPHHHIHNSVVYTGTHDNNTTAGWYKHDTSAAIRKHIAGYLGKHVSAKTIVPDMIRLAMASCADLCIIPMQDILNLDASARMNNPAARKGNWLWRMPPDSLTPTLSRKLRRIIELYGRC